MRLVNRRDESETPGCQAFSCRFLSGSGFIRVELAIDWAPRWIFHGIHEVLWSQRALKYYTYMLFYWIQASYCSVFFVDIPFLRLALIHYYQTWRIKGRRVSCCMRGSSQVVTFVEKPPQRCLEQSRWFCICTHLTWSSAWLTVTMCCILRIMPNFAEGRIVLQACIRGHQSGWRRFEAFWWWSLLSK